MKRPALKNLLQTYGTVLALIVIAAVFSIIRPTQFCTLKNFINITRQISLLVMISLGATLVMSVNEFDLSVGSMASLGGVMAALLAVRGLPMAVCFLVPVADQFLRRAAERMDRGAVPGAVLYHHAGHEHCALRRDLPPLRRRYRV